MQQYKSTARILKEHVIVVHPTLCVSQVGRRKIEQHTNAAGQTET